MKALLAILLSSLAVTAFAQTQGYVTASDGSIVKTGTGLCLHTGTWTPADAVEGCDGFKKPQAQNPVIVNAQIGADVLFDFDKATLKPAGKAQLDKLAAVIQGKSTVIVVGNTDRIGPKDYNKKLSLARAQTVAKYLQSVNPKGTYHIDGVGSAKPVTNGCYEVKGWNNIVTCLVPDRRVDISIIH